MSLTNFRYNIFLCALILSSYSYGQSILSSFPSDAVGTERSISDAEKLLDTYSKVGGDMTAKRFQGILASFKEVRLSRSAARSSLSNINVSRHSPTATFDNRDAHNPQGSLFTFEESSTPRVRSQDASSAYNAVNPNTQFYDFFGGEPRNAAASEQLTNANMNGATTGMGPDYLRADLGLAYDSLDNPGGLLLDFDGY